MNSAFRQIRRLALSNSAASIAASLLCVVLSSPLATEAAADTPAATASGQQALAQTANAAQAKPSAEDSEKKTRAPLDCVGKKNTLAPATSPPLAAASPPPPPEASRLLVELANDIIWQPRDGRVRFTVTTIDNKSPSPINDIEIAVCFGWPPLIYASADTDQTPALYRSSYLRMISRTDTSATYETNLPDELWSEQNKALAPDFWDIWKDFFNQWSGKPIHAYNGWGLVPLVHMHVVARSQGAKDVPSDPNALDTVLSVGITFRLVALAITIFVVGSAWLILLAWANYRHVRGGAILRIIANRNNYASLSQFQILLWTFVIGAGLTYVMALTGALIDVPTQDLALLGIAGFSALSAAYTSNKQQPAQPAQPAEREGNRPPADTIGVIRGLQSLSLGNTTAVLFWQPPECGPSIANYSISLTALPLPQNPPPQIMQADPTQPFVQLSGLLPATHYTIAVVAHDATGLSSDPVAVDIRTCTAPLRPTPSVSVSAQIPDCDNIAILTWQQTSKADAYIIQYRRACTSDWTTGQIAMRGFPGTTHSASYESANLDYMTAYEFRTAAALDGQLGPWSNITAIKTGERIPRWSDLVVWDGVREIDITRVQMLAFTVLAAVFVILKIGNDSAIPIIPDGIILLMGLSNTLYVGGKFVPGAK